jgi:hypothetical protein
VEKRLLNAPRNYRHVAETSIALLIGSLMIAGCLGSALGQQAKGIDTSLPRVVLSEVPLALMHNVDSNSPVHWDGKTLYLINSADGHQYVTSGPDIAHLGYRNQAHLGDTDDRLYIWIEATWKADDGTLYGAYHYEPDALCKSNNHLPTAPKIAWIRSHDNGNTWEDLGFIISANPASIKCDSASPWDVGGTGDFSFVPDRSQQYLYFYGTSYDPHFEEQGIFAARMRISDRNNPSGKVWKWHKGEWSEPGLWGRVTPIFAPEKDFTQLGGAMFWGPSISWNTHLGMYVMLLNHATDPELNSDGIYISFNQRVDDPAGWSRPQMILDRAGIQKVMQGVNLSPTKMANGWYPEVVGDGPGETDSLAGRTGRLFLAGVSRLQITFVRPGEDASTSEKK